MAGWPTQTVELCKFNIKSCLGCDSCRAPLPCRLEANEDQAKELFCLLLAAKVAIFSSPVYFYAMPAHFKSFIDRGQWQWKKGDYPKISKAAICLQAAGRSKGMELFTATRRSLAWFLRFFGYEMVFDRGWMGLEAVKDLERAPEILENVKELGFLWGTKLIRAV